MRGISLEGHSPWAAARKIQYYKEREEAATEATLVAVQLAHGGSRALGCRTGGGEGAGSARVER